MACGVIGNGRRQRHNAAVMDAFQQVADDLVGRTERIVCTLEERQRGLLLIQECLDTMLQIVNEERLQS